jgi:hypothetical protein
LDPCFRPTTVVRPLLGPVGRRWVTALAVAVCLVWLACAGGLSVGVSAWSQRRAGAAQSPRALLTAAAAALSDVPAVRLRMATLDGTGRAASADVTVTAEHLAAGTVTDPGGGRADLVADSTATAVRGDRPWWARRAPDQVGAVSGRWVQPEPGTAFATDIARWLTPAELGRLLSAMADTATTAAPTPSPGSSATPEEPGRIRRASGPVADRG